MYRKTEMIINISRGQGVNIKLCAYALALMKCTSMYSFMIIGISGGFRNFQRGVQATKGSEARGWG